MYSAGQLNSGNLAGNQFVNFSIIALTEMPSCFVGAFLIWKIGRRWSHVLCMMFAALPNLAIIGLIGNEANSDVTVLAVISRRVVEWYKHSSRYYARRCHET